MRRLSIHLPPRGIHSSSEAIPEMDKFDDWMAESPTEPKSRMKDQGRGASKNSGQPSNSCASVDTDHFDRSCHRVIQG